MDNADADDMKYRKGNYFLPEKQCDGADEDMVALLFATAAVVLKKK